MMRPTFAAPRMVALRASLGVSQGTLGELLGVTAMTVSRWERLAALPTAYQVAMLEAFERAAATGRAGRVAGAVAERGAIAALAELLALGTNSCATPRLEPPASGDAR